MADMISRAAAIDHIKAMAGCAKCDNYNYVRCRACSWDDAMNIVEELPAVDAAPVVHGRWIYKDRHRKSYRQYTGFDAAGETHTITVLEESKGKDPYCSECGAQAAESFMDFCPRCGAKMDGERRDENEAD